ncbi:MAG: hypothetical protein JXR96_08320 [Deltaproteobacteria bacterium]|nr:hypothetical protein [Deltaproteobacteria bacterium]
MAAMDSDEGYSPLNPFHIYAGVESPAGDKLAFVAGHSYDDEEILVWSPDTDELVNYSRSFGKRSTPGRVFWSPRGDAIAAPMHPLPGSGHDLVILRRDAEPAVVDSGDPREVQWSPGSDRIAFTDRGRLFAVRADGTGKTGLNQRVQGAQQPVWWHDGEREVLAFLAIGEVYAAPLDGSGEQRLTLDGGYETLALAAGGKRLEAIRATGDPERPFRKVYIEPGTERTVPGELLTRPPGSGWTPGQARLPQESIAAGGKTLERSRVERFFCQSGVEKAKRTAAEMRVLEPDPRTTAPRGRMLSLPRKTIPFPPDLQLVAKLEVAAARIPRTFRLSRFELELAGVRVRARGDDDVSMHVGLRHGARIGYASIDASRGDARPFDLETLRKEPPEGSKRIRALIRRYALALTRLTVDPETGVWSSFELCLLRRDEKQVQPTLRQHGRRPAQRPASRSTQVDPTKSSPPTKVNGSKSEVLDE